MQDRRSRHRHLWFVRNFMENKQSVVIVGGGFAGRTARRWLQDDFDVTLIDAKGYFEFVPSVLRCFVEPDHAFKTILPHPEGTMIATVTAVHADGTLYAFVMRSEIKSLQRLSLRMENAKDSITVFYAWVLLILIPSSPISQHP